MNIDMLLPYKIFYIAVWFKLFKNIWMWQELLLKTFIDYFQSIQNANNLSIILNMIASTPLFFSGDSWNIGMIVSYQIPAVKLNEFSVFN